MTPRPGEFRNEVATATAAHRACRWCDVGLSHLPPVAKFCPNCGQPVSAPTIRATSRSSRGVRWTAAVVRGLRSIVHGWHPAMGYPFLGDPDRSKVVTGYGNALFNLGWRYERGWDVRRNLPEALRCYSKSSKLGNIDATVRLPPVQAATDEGRDRSLDPPVPVMPIWRAWDWVEADRHERNAQMEQRAYEWLTSRGLTDRVDRNS